MAAKTKAPTDRKKTRSCPGCGARIRPSRTVCQDCYLRARRLAGKSYLTREEILEVLGKPVQEHAARSVRTTARQRVQSVAGDVMVCSDLHVPFHDPVMVDRLCAVARRYGVEQLVIAGDLVDFDQISRYRRTTAAGPTVVESLMLAIDLLSVLAAQFRRIWVIRGNHDDRLQRVIERAVTSRTGEQKILADLEQEEWAALPFRQRLVAVLERWTAQAAADLEGVVTWSEEPMLRVSGPKGLEPWLVVHPAIYSRHAPQAEKRLWQRYTCSIIGSHGHIFGASVSPNGRHAVVQLGCMTDPEKHVYLMDRVTDHPAWVRGFGMIRKGRLRLFPDHPYYTDWEEECAPRAQ